MSYPPPQQERLLRKTLPLGFYSSSETLKMFEEDTVTSLGPPPPHPAPVIFSSAQKQGTVRRVRAGIGWQGCVCPTDGRYLQTFGTQCSWQIQCFLSVRVSEERSSSPMIRHSQGPRQGLWRGWGHGHTHTDTHTHTHTQSAQACQG